MSPRNTLKPLVTSYAAVEDLIMQADKPTSTESSWVASRYGREEVGTLESLTVPLSNLSVSYPVKPPLEEYSADGQLSKDPKG